MNMLTIKPLNSHLQQIAEGELEEVAERIPNDLENFRQWIQQQQHLRAREDDQFLIQFLRGCKYNVEKAKEKFDRYYTLETKYPEIFCITNVDDVTFRTNYNLGTFLPLTTPLNEFGPRIMVFRFNYSPKSVPIDALFHSINAIPQVLLIDDAYACICGLVFIVDMSEFTSAHLLQLTPPFLKKIVTYYENILPFRIKGIYCINVNRIAEQLIKLLLSIMGEKLRKRVFIYGKQFDSIFSNIPQKYLPLDYGGQNGQLDQLCVEFNQKWNEYREYFQENINYGTIESLRAGKPFDFDGIFGMGGTFRKLDVD
ncbi:alpha-tocopherol transfer protein-like [Musca autumnalis]|uniref:alpha-tocopherol transfer protein-like n=1 Tax=Musca autumnalis TaxID=221902 RepID=UPI003CEE2605